MEYIVGSFSGIGADKVHPIVGFEYSQNIAENKTYITTRLIFKSVSANWGAGISSPTNLHIGSATGAWGAKHFTVNANSEMTLIIAEATLTHLADGSGSAYIGASGNTDIFWGSYNFGRTITFPTIPRGASITSSANFMAGNSIPISFNNPANGYLQVRVFVHDGTDYNPFIKDVNFGRVTSGTITFTKAEINKIYTQLGGVNRGCILRVYTYSDSGYSNQIGDYFDKLGTCSIPARAVLSGNANLTIGDNKSVSFTNTNGKYVRLEFWINGSGGWYKVKDQNAGTGTSSTFTMSGTDNNNMYSRMANVTSVNSIIRAYTYAHSDYTTQIRDYHDITGTVSINQSINKPEFSTFTVGNIDKSIANKDKYGNTLVTSSTSTLLGANTRMIKGFSKLRAVITSGNKMVAKNYATASKYRFASGSKFADEDYKASGTVNIDLDNAENSTVSVTAYDSRGLTTSVSNNSTITNNANYVPVNLWGMELVRDNGVDAKTKLKINGSFWKEYFGGGSSGVLNTITAHYRYKETTDAWGGQSWNALTLTDSSGALSFDNYINGDKGVNGFDTEKSFDIEVRIYDKLTNIIVERTLNVGIPVMEIVKEGVAIKGRYDELEGGDLQIRGKNIIDIILDYAYPIGTIYTTTSSALDTVAKMNAHFGGTWEAYGSGRVLVAISSDTEFNTVDAEYGSKNLQKHSHNVPFRVMTNVGGFGYANPVGITLTNNVLSKNVDAVSEEVGTGDSENIQPSKVVYRYRRTA